MKHIQSTDQYALLLKSFRTHSIKGAIAVLMFFGAVLALIYFFFLPETLDLFNSLFIIGPVLIVCALAFIMISIVKLLSNLNKDIKENSYDTFTDRLNFIQVRKTKSRYSEQLILEQHKDVKTNLTNIRIYPGDEYEFTVSKHTRLIVDAKQIKTSTEEEEPYGHKKHDSYAGTYTAAFSTSVLVRLEDDEMNSYRKSHIIPSLIVSAMIGGFGGMIAGVLLNLVLKDYYPDKSGLIIICSMLTGVAILFFFIFRSTIKSNDKVLANPYKKILPATIDTVKEVSRSKRTYYH